MKRLIIVLVLFSATINAQITFEKGYIVTLKGDTVQGEIKLNPKKEIDFFSKIYFKVSETEKKAYKPNKIMEYNIRGQAFVSKKLDGQDVFLRRATQGAIIFYEYEYEEASPTGDVMSNFDYYVQKSGQEELIKIKENKFRKQLSELMSDNPDVVAILDDKKTEYTQMLDIVKKYNEEAASN